MKFKFCGDLDCPDWVLAEINTLSKLSSIKMKVLCQIVARSLIGEQFDFFSQPVKVKKFLNGILPPEDFTDEEKAVKLLLDAKLNEDDMKACTEALSVILTSSARYEVEEDALNSELQQLGLPKEHATALCKVYSEQISAITEKLGAKSLTISSLEEATCTMSDNGRPHLKLKIKDHIKNSCDSHSITMSQEQLVLLLKELKFARDEMKSLPG